MKQLGIEAQTLTNKETCEVLSVNVSGNGTMEIKRYSRIKKENS